MSTGIDKGKWKRVGNGLVFVVPEHEVPIKMATAWKRLLRADNDLAHTSNMRKEGANWATADALDACRTENTRAIDNWRAVCRVMGYKGRNGRVWPVHLVSHSNN